MEDIDCNSMEDLVEVYTLWFGRQCFKLKVILDLSILLSLLTVDLILITILHIQLNLLYHFHS